MKELTEDMYQGTVGFINNIMDDGRLFYLYDRWQNEKEYEDFADYIEHAKDFIEEFGLTFIKMTKSHILLFVFITILYFIIVY